jgi:hypothetical protein
MTDLPTEDYLDNLVDTSLYEDTDMGEASDHNNPTEQENATNVIPPTAVAIDPGKNQNNAQSVENDTNPTLQKENVNKESDEKIINQFIDKRQKLLNESLKIEDPNQFEVYQKRITQIDKMIQTLKANIKNNIQNNHPQQKQKTDKQIKIHKNDIPHFQLIDDELNTKIHTKPSYNNVEAFISAFETIFQLNELDIEAEWNRYLPVSFAECGKESYRRFFEQKIKSLPTTTKWKHVKQKIIQRFGEYTNNTYKIKNFLTMKQDKSEKIRDYIDRYLEAYSRINGNNPNSQSPLESARFINTLLPIARNKVEDSLKNNYKNESEDPGNIYPNGLSELFNFLIKHMSDIQEEIVITLLNKNSKDKYEPDNTYQKKRKFHSENEEQSNKKFKNPCNYCNKSEHSINHLNSCVDYLKSPEYKAWILKQQAWKQKEKSNQVKIYYNQTEPEKTKTNLINELHKDLDLELQETLKDALHKYNFQEGIFKIQTKYINLIHKHNQSIFKKLNNKHIKCYNVNDLSEKEVQDLSPFSPAIIINNEKIIAMIDTGSPISLINKRYDFEDKSIFINIIPTKGSFSFIDHNVTAQRTGKTQPLKIEYKGKVAFNHSFEIVEMPEKKLPILIGRDLIPKLGITIEGIAYNFENNEDITFDDTVNHEKYIPNVSKACSEKEYMEFVKDLEPYMKANGEINVHDLCPLPEAVVYLKTPPGEFAFTRQYPVAYSLQPVVREQIKKWANDKTIEPAIPSGFNSPLTLVPKPADSKGNKRWRVCLDTRRINNLLEDTASINTPIIDDIFFALRNAKIYSVFDATGAFHRLPIHEADKHKLTFSFEGKSWQFRGAAFGLKSLSGIFQNVMERILENMKDFTCIYIDDLVVYSQDLASHQIHCRKVIEALTKYKIIINFEKTHLARNAVYLLGFSISEEGKSIDVNRLTNIDDWEKPRTPKAMMKFCGWVSYMRAHLPKASALTAPLDHLRYSVNKTLTWTPEMDAHYGSIVNILKENIKLSHPDLNHPFAIQVDASNYAVASTLMSYFDFSQDHSFILPT